MLKPVNRTIKVAAFFARFRCREDRGAVVQSFPIWQARAGIFGPHWIPPILARDRIVITHIDDTAFFHGSAEGCAKGTFPNFHLQRDVAQTDGFVDGLAICCHIFNAVACTLKDLANNVRHHNLARPVVNWNHDWVAAVFCKNGKWYKRKCARRQCCFHHFHSTSPYLTRPLVGAIRAPSKTGSVGFSFQRF